MSFTLERAAEPGRVSAIHLQGVPNPIGFTRWELNGPAQHTAGSWRVLSANGRPTGILRSTERAAARSWAEMIGGRGPRSTPDVDPVLRAFATRVLLLPHIQAELPLGRRGVRAARRLTLHVTEHAHHYTSGWAGDWTIRLRCGTDPIERDEAIVHEVCHLALDPLDAGGRWDSHGPGFRLRLRLAIQALYGIDVPEPPDRAGHSNLAYALDAAIVRALKQQEQAR